MYKIFYAELDDNMICKGVSQLSGEVISDRMIQIERYDESLVGMKYIPETNSWEEVEYEETEVVSEPSQLDRIEEAVNKSHEEIANEAIDAYTLELIEGGILV